MDQNHFYFCIVKYNNICGARFHSVAQSLEILPLDFFCIIIKIGMECFIFVAQLGPLCHYCLYVNEIYDYSNFGIFGN